MRTIDDTSALNASTIDVAARIGWITRMARVTSDAVNDRRLTSLAARIGVSPAHLSRVETGKRRDGSLLTAYEQELDLVEGTLRSPVDILCRTFPDQSPRDLAPDTSITQVAALSGLTDQLLSGDPVTGGTWLRWARELARPNNVSLPVSLFLPLCQLLVDELSRSVTAAYAPRRDALALLGSSAYGGLVLEVAREVTARPYAPGLNTLLGVVGKVGAPPSLDWALALLHDDRDELVEAGAHALEHLGQATGGALWATTADRLLDAFDASKPDSVAEAWTAHLIRLVPRSVWHELALTPRRPLPPAPEIREWSRDTGLWELCSRTGDSVTEPLGLPSQPLLARLLFDATFSPWESRAVTSYILLSAVPALSRTLTDRLAVHIEQLKPSPIRDRAARRLLGIRHGALLTTTERWFDDDAPTLRRAAYKSAGSSGLVLDAEKLRRGLLDPSTRREAIYAAGMSEHPELTTLSTDTSLDPSTRAGLVWWLDQGGRILR